MAFAYFKQDGTVLTVSSIQTPYDDETVIEVEVADFTQPNNVYLDLETLEVREKQPFTLSISYNLVSDVPLGATVTMPDGQHVIDDGSIEFEADVPETVWLYIDHPHFIAQWISVETGQETE